MFARTLLYKKYNIYINMISSFNNKTISQKIKSDE